MRRMALDGRHERPGFYRGLGAHHFKSRRHDGEANHHRNENHRRVNPSQLGCRGDRRSTPGRSPQADKRRRRRGVAFRRSGATGRRCLSIRWHCVVRLVADEGVDRHTVERLRSEGNVVLYIAESEPGITDDAVLRAAVEENALLLNQFWATPTAMRAAPDPR